MMNEPAHEQHNHSAGQSAESVQADLDFSQEQFSVPMPVSHSDGEAPFFQRDIDSEVSAHSEDIFPVGHELHALKRPNHSALIERLKHYDINCTFRTSKYEEDRRAVRPCFGELYGPGADLPLPSIAAYLVKPGHNRAYMAKDQDPELIAYMMDIGLLTERPYSFGSFDEMFELVQNADRPVYTMDDLGERFDPYCLNSQRDFEIINSKEYVTKLTSYAPPQKMVSLDEVTREDFAEVWTPGRMVFVKSCNTEAGSGGVHPISVQQDFEAAYSEFCEKCEQLKAQQTEYGLTDTIVMQPQIVGENRSLQLYIDPDEPDCIQVIGLSLQINGEDGFSYAGSVNIEVNAESIAPVGAAMIDYVQNIWRICPEARGFAMCDYFQCEDGSVVLYDPGLRPTASTPGIMMQLWIKEHLGRDVAVSSWVNFDTGTPGIRYAEIVERLGVWADPSAIAETGFGVLPLGHNYIAGKVDLMLVTPEASDCEALERHLQSLLYREPQND